MTKEEFETIILFKKMSFISADGMRWISMPVLW